MKIGDIEIDDKAYNKLSLNLLVSLCVETTAVREFLMMSLSENQDENLTKIHETWKLRHEILWNDLTRVLYANYGKLDFDDLLHPDNK